MMKTLAMSSLDGFQNLYKKCTDMKNDNLLLVACFVLFIISIVCIYQDRVIQKQQKLLEQVDTITKHDTIFNTFVITDTVPVIKTKKVFLTDTLWRSNGDTVKLDLKKKEYTNTLIQGEDTVSYNAYISGYDINDEGMPMLDSINIQTNSKIINTTTIIEKPVANKQSRWNVTAGVGTGYGVINKQADVYLGFTIGYRVW